MDYAGFRLYGLGPIFHPLKVSGVNEDIFFRFFSASFSFDEHSLIHPKDTSPPSSNKNHTEDDTMFGAKKSNKKTKEVTTGFALFLNLTMSMCLLQKQQ